MTFYPLKYLFFIAMISIRYLVVAGLFFYFTQKLWAQRTRTAMVNSKPQFKGQLNHELKFSMVTVLIFALGGLNFIFAKESHWGLIYTDIGEWGMGYFIFSIFLMLILHDWYFYWTHRWLHRKENFGRFHSVHHRSKVTTPFTSQSFHWVESFINMGPSLIFPFIFPLHPTAYIIFTIVAFAYNVYGHGNYDFLPKRWRNHALFRWINSPSNHGYHHDQINGNYGFYTTIWDRAHGTYVNADICADDFKR